MTEKTAYVVMLPLTSEDELSLTEKATDYVWGSLNSIVDAIGTPVDSSVPVVTTLGTLREPVPCVRQFDYLAALAEKQAEVERLRKALKEQKTFHESEDKALSKQPPSGQGLWRRNQHQEQIELIDVALAGAAS